MTNRCLVGTSSSAKRLIYQTYVTLYRVYTPVFILSMYTKLYKHNKIYYRILMDIIGIHLCTNIINMYILYHPVSFLSNSIHLLSQRLLLRFFGVNLFCHKFPLISHLLKPLNRSLGTASFHAPNVSWRRQKSSSPSVP